MYIFCIMGNLKKAKNNNKRKTAGNQTGEREYVKPDLKNKCRGFIVIACVILIPVLLLSARMHVQLYNDECSQKVESMEIDNIMRIILSKDVSSDLRADILMQSIVLYTTQLEDYDKNNITAGMSCIGFIGLIITAVAAVLAGYKKENSSFFNQAIAVVLLFVPEIFVLFLYNFAMASRRSAIFRGYLMFLEEVLNKELGADYMLLNQQLIPNQLSNFSVNTNGPIVLGIFIVIFMVLFFGISCYFAWRSKNGIFFKVYYWFFIIFAIICIYCSCWYVAYLRTNGEVIYNAKAMCEQHLNSMTLDEAPAETIEPDNHTEQNEKH